MDEAASYKIIKFKAIDLPSNYKNLVWDSFLKSHRQNNKYMALIEYDHYKSNYAIYIGNLLARPDALIKLAVLTDDPDIVIGWSLIEPGIVHYVHVKADCRRIGIASHLLSESFNTITHFTTLGLKLRKLKCPEVKFKPFS